MVIENSSRGIVLAAQVEIAGNFYLRLRGLLGISGLRPGAGLYLTPCRGVHTFGLRFPIDAVYVNARGVVLQVLTLTPWRCGPFLLPCQGVLELPPGTGTAGKCIPGDQLRQVPEKGW
ncbi:DUF192 domain-containing protein [candidate division FCPU426 bacterium]|nr:DUF192 domain-containing protein [candidate division FCPU426 bacterium]